MPKLLPDAAAKVEAVEDGFKPMPEGVYILQLREDVEIKEGPQGPYWKWSFEVPKEHDGEEQPNSGRRLFTNTSLSDDSYWKLKEVFKAFGVATDTDTEDLVGKRVKAVVVIRPIGGGARKGELTNDISKLHPLDYDEDAATEKADAAAKGGSSDEPMF